jgi:hypothetical protein
LLCPRTGGTGKLADNEQTQLKRLRPSWSIS